MDDELVILKTRCDHLEMKIVEMAGLLNKAVRLIHETSIHLAYYDERIERLENGRL